MEPTGTIREYKPTWRERAANALADLVEGMGADRWKANKIAQTLLGGERSNLPAGIGLSDLAAFGVVPGAPAALRAASVPAGLLNYADASKEGNPFSALTVWHGSPHKFDKFDSAHIGRGEGAQAYGHGLYLAESPGVAESYAKILPQRKAMDPSWWADKRLPEFLTVEEQKTLNAIKEKLHRTVYGGKNPTPDEMAVYRRLQDKYSAYNEAVEAAKPVGALYKVDLPDNLVARMLDWDKPLSQQAPEVQKIAEQFLNGPMQVLPTGYKVVPGSRGGFQPMAPGGTPMTNAIFKTEEQAKNYALDMLNEFRLKPDTKGAHVYSMFDRDQQAAADMLRRAGIPGIRYLDGNSRGAGAGSYNYVVFPGEENALTILERNGNPIQRLAR